ncbi:flagellar hook-associated protein FlgL [Thermithiobacillus plumbiphilus]|uniref:Flagellar hook-associated protein FlgL n=1 Tax=Thermithiobacillus plumbiphilus TaxID=1729899 RepID=A0ABU9DAM2_9PROT
MRISTALFHQLGVNSMLNQQAELSRTQQQLSTGRKILNPADDPVGSAQIVGFNQSLASIEQYNKNADQAQSAVQLEESIYGQVDDLLQNVRERVVQMNNASQTNETRGFAATEVRQQLQQLLSLANTQDGNGQYLFAGSKSNTQPFNSDFSYNGDQSTRRMQVSNSRQIDVAAPGDRIFSLVRDGNGTFATAPSAANTGTGIIDQGSVVDPAQWVAGDYTLSFTGPDTYDITDGSGPVASNVSYTSGETIIDIPGIQFSISGAPSPGDSFTIKASSSQSMFETLDKIASALDKNVNTPAEQAALNNTLNASLGNLDQALGQVLTARADAGTRLKELDSVRSANEDQVIYYKQAISVLQDTDFAEAASRLSQQALALEAAQKSYVQVRDLSLFNYI